MKAVERFPTTFIDWVGLYLIGLKDLAPATCCASFRTHGASTVQTTSDLFTCTAAERKSRYSHQSITSKINRTCACLPHLNLSALRFPLLLALSVA